MHKYLVLSMCSIIVSIIHTHKTILNGEDLYLHELA